MRGKRKVKKSAALVRMTSLIDIRAIRIEAIIVGVRSKKSESESRTLGFYSDSWLVISDFFS